MVSFYQIVGHVWYVSLTRILLSTKKSLLVLTISYRSTSTLIGNVCHTWCGTYMRVLTTACWSFSEWLSIVSWHPELICDILTTFIYFGSNQTSTSSGILMCFIMQILVFIVDKWRVVSVLFRQHRVNLNLILRSWLSHLLSLTYRVPVLSSGLVIDTSMRFHSLILHLILNWIWSSVWLRWCPLDIAILDRTLATDCDFLVSFECIGWRDNCLRRVHSLGLWIA